jgi:hypothetical protein
MRALPRPLLLIVGLSLLLALVLLVDLVPFLRGGFGWQWPYDPVALARVLPLIMATGIYVVGAWWLLRRTRGDRLLILWSFIGVVALSIAGLWLRSDDALYELFVRTASGVTTGQHFAGVEIDWSNPQWVNWPVTVQPFVGRSGHIVLSGPALPLFYGALNNALEQAPAISAPLQRALLYYQCRNYDLLAYSPAEWASAWFGMLMPVWAALAVIPLYAVTRRLTGTEGARLAVGWWPLIPALILFTPTWNTVYPLFALIAFWMLLRGLQGAAVWLIASGLVCGLLTFANFSLVPLLGLFGFYALLNAFSRRQRWYQPIIVGLWFAVGLIAPWLIYWLASGLTPLDLLNHAMANHLILERPYLPWLWLHSWEWALLTGIPVLVLWLLFAARRRLQSPVDVLAWALLLTMLTLVFSGTARGETGRVWLFFVPFVLICAAGQVTQGWRGIWGEINDAGNWLAVSIGQAALLIVVCAVWLLINAPNMTPPPSAPGPVLAERLSGATFENKFQLAEWDAQRVGDHIELRLNWQPVQQMTTAYWFAALLVAPDGSLPQDSVVWQALDTAYPTTCWKAGEMVGDTIHLPLPDDVQSGEWWISLSVFGDKEQPEQRLSVVLHDGTTDHQIGLGPVPIQP